MLIYRRCHFTNHKMKVITEETAANVNLDSTESWSCPRHTLMTLVRAIIGVALTQTRFAHHAMW